MTTREGIYFRLDRDQAKKLFGLRDPQQLNSWITELRAAAQTHESALSVPVSQWEALHLALTGSREADAGEPPGNQVVLGARPLGDESQYLIRLIRPDMTGHLAEALRSTRQDDFTQRCQDHSVPTEFIEELWTLCQELAEFFEQAAGDREAVVFTAGT